MVPNYAQRLLCDVYLGLLCLHGMQVIKGTIIEVFIKAPVPPRHPGHQRHHHRGGHKGGAADSVALVDPGPECDNLVMRISDIEMCDP